MSRPSYGETGLTIDVPGTRPALLVDGHVHFHDCFTWKAFLDAASSNFAGARRQLGLTNYSPGCLMFTESAGAHAYRVLAEQPGVARAHGWQDDRGDEGFSVTLHRDGSDIIVVAGRQIITAERLEVLALGCVDELRDHQPIRDVLREVADSGAIPIIPWGFGKWLGRRGRILRNLIDADITPPFFIGDNGGRARAMGRPALFDAAEGRGVLVLGGSDPMSMAAQVTRPGSYGFVLDGWCATSQPFTAIRTAVEALRQSPAAFGALSSLRSMVRAQLGIRLQRHRVGVRGRQAAVR